MPDACSYAFGFVKINMVVVRGINDSDIINMIDNFKDPRIQLRFIEYMDVGETNNWNKKRVMTSDEIIHTIKQKYSLIQMTQEENATAEKWKFTDNTGELAFISSISKSPTKLNTKSLESAKRSS